MGKNYIQLDINIRVSKSKSLLTNISHINITMVINTQKTYTINRTGVPEKN